MRILRVWELWWASGRLGTSNYSQGIVFTVKVWELWRVSLCPEPEMRSLLLKVWELSRTSWVPQGCVVTIKLNYWGALASGRPGTRDCSQGIVLTMKCDGFAPCMQKLLPEGGRFDSGFGSSGRVLNGFRPRF